MAPRRGSGGGSSYGYYSNNPWAEEVLLSLDMQRSKTLFIAGFAFDVLTLLALIGFSIWACTIRNGRGQLNGVLVALIIYLLSMIAGIIYEIFFLANASVTEYYNIDLMLNDFFSLASGCLILFVFYNLIHKTLDRLTDAGKPYAVVSIIHWVVLGLVSVVSLAAFALYVTFLVQLVQNGYYSSMVDTWQKLEAARAILWWVLSLEIMAWFVFIVIKAGSHRFSSRLPIFSLLGGSIAWMALCLTSAIIYIRYALENHSTPVYINCVQGVLQFFFLVGTFVGILLACMKWRSVDDREDKHMVAPYPYAPGQYQAYPAYQQQHPVMVQQHHPYPQAHHQQPYPQPTQQAYQQPAAQPDQRQGN